MKTFDTQIVEKFYKNLGFHSASKGKSEGHTIWKHRDNSRWKFDLQSRKHAISIESFNHGFQELENRGYKNREILKQEWRSFIKFR